MDKLAAPATALDFAGLGRLKGAARERQDDALRQTAQQFEAMFIQMMLKSMREASFKSDLVESGAMDTYEQMFDKEVAMAMSKRGALGIADLLTEQLKRQQPQPAADVLAQRAVRTAAPGFELGAPGRALPLAVDRPAFGLRRADEGLPVMRGAELKTPARPAPGQ